MKTTKPAIVSAAALVVSALSACGGGDGGAGNRAPRIEGLMDATVSANQTSAGLAFTVADDGPLMDIQLEATSDNPEVLTDDGIEFAGTGTDRQVLLTPVPGQLGRTIVTITARDAEGAAATVDFGVDVEAESVSFAAFLRSTFAAAADDEPRDLNSRVFEQDAMQGAFEDLVAAP